MLSCSSLIKLHQSNSSVMFADALNVIRIENKTGGFHWKLEIVKIDVYSVQVSHPYIQSIDTQQSAFRKRYKSHVHCRAAMHGTVPTLGLALFKPDYTLLCICACDRVAHLPRGILRIYLEHRIWFIPENWTTSGTAATLQQFALIGPERCLETNRDNLLIVNRPNIVHYNPVWKFVARVDRVIESRNSIGGYESRLYYLTRR